MINQQEIELTIHDITSHGHGVGRFEDSDGKKMVVFVPGLIPGETAKVRITEDKKNYRLGEIIEITEKSTGRRTPPCPHFDICPGCSMQFMEYGTQLSARVGRVQGVLSRAIDDEIKFDVTPSPAEFGYRTHLSLKYEKKDDHIAIGFTDPATRRVVDIPSCMLMPDWAAGSYTLLREKIVRNARDLPQSFRLRLFFDRDSKTMFVVPPRGPQKRHRDIPKGFGGMMVGFPKPGVMKKKIAGVKMRIHPASFSQANMFLVEPLYKTALKFADPGALDTVLDLYSGSGFFSLALCEIVKETVALEADKRACDNLQQSATDLVKMTQKAKKPEPSITIIQGQAEILIDQAIEEFKPTVVIANPPRSGLHKNVTASLKLVESPIRRIVMISCDPSTCARDLKSLSEAGFKTSKTSLLDCYPQTPHMETITLLDR